MNEKNFYSKDWFDNFLVNYPQKLTDRDNHFISNIINKYSVTKCLDICCGDGRHLLGQVGKNLELIGIDRDKDSLDRLIEKDLTSEIKIYHGDMREIPEEVCELGLISCLWQSFGFFSREDNFQTLKTWFSKLSADGICLLDIYNKDFYSSRPLGLRKIGEGEQVIEEVTELQEGRLKVTLRYPTGEGDVFDWQIFSPEEIEAFALEAGFKAVEVFSNFDLKLSPNRDNNRMQILLKKSSL